MQTSKSFISACNDLRSVLKRSALLERSEKKNGKKSHGWRGQTLQAVLKCCHAICLMICEGQLIGDAKEDVLWKETKVEVYSTHWKEVVIRE